MPSNERYTEPYRAVPERQTRAYVIPPLDEDPRYSGVTPGRGRRPKKSAVAVPSSAPARQSSVAARPSAGRADRQPRSAPQNGQRRRGGCLGQLVWVVVMIAILLMTVARPLLDLIVDEVSDFFSEDASEAIVHDEGEPEPRSLEDPDGLVDDVSVEILSEDGNWIEAAVSVTNSADATMSYAFYVVAVADDGDSGERFVYAPDMEPGETFVEERSIHLEAVGDGKEYDILIADITRW